MTNKRDYTAHKKPLIHYVYHPHRPDQRLAVFVALIHPDDGKIHIGFAQCRDGDRFCKKFGREVAIERALKGSSAVPHPIRFYRPDGSYVKKNVVNSELDLFRLRAIQYFTPQLCEADDRLLSKTDLVIYVTTEHRGEFEQALRAARD